MADGKIVIDVIMDDGSIKQGVANIEGIGKAGEKAGMSLKNMVGAGLLIKGVSAAMGVLKSSVGSAVERFDTLQKFPKVMESLGFNTEKSAKASKKLSDGIDGLPTTLQEVVANTQRMTAITGDLDKSTDATIAMNNAFLASGASTDQAARGMDQYMKMVSTGKVELDGWTTLQETMPLALQKTAEAMGFVGKTAQNDLYSALKNGTVTFDQFQDKMIELGTGTGQLADLAKKNSLGIGTSFKNLQSAITKGMANILTKFDEIVQKLTGKNIAQNFDSLKGIINATFSFIVDSMDKVLPLLQTFSTAFQVLGNFMQPLVPIIAGLTAAFVTYQTVMSVAKGAMVAFNAVQTIFNALLAANPIGLIVTAIIGLVAGIIYLWNTSEGFKNAVIVIWTAISEFLSPIISGIAEFITTTWGILVEWWKTNQQSMSETVSTVWNAIKAVFDVVMEAISLVVTTVLTNIKAFWDTWGQAIMSVVQVVWAFISAVFQNTLGNILAVVTSIFNQIGNVITLVMNVIQNIIKIALSLIKGDWQGVLEGIKGIISAFGSFVRNTFNNIMNLGKNIIKNGINAIKGFFTSLGDIDLFSAGKAIIDGFLKGLKQKFEDVKNFVGGIADWIKEHKGPLPYDKRLLIPAGKAIMDGFNKSLEAGFEGVQKNVSSMAGRLASNMDLEDTTLAIQGGFSLPKVTAESALGIGQRLNASTSNVSNYYSTTNNNQSDLSNRAEVIEVHVHANLDKKEITKELTDPIRVAINKADRFKARKGGQRI